MLLIMNTAPLNRFVLIRPSLPHRSAAAAATLLATLAFLPACKSLENDSGSRHSSGSIFDDSNSYSGSGRNNSNQPSSPAVHPGRIPESAEVGSSGFGHLRYEAQHAGTVWVANTTRGYEVVSHAVRRGDKVEVIPGSDRIELNDKSISTNNLESNDEHTIYFRPNNWTSGPRAYSSIPRSAQSVAHGFGEVSWRAEAAGTVWIGDDNNKRMLLTHPVKADDFVEIDPSQDRVKLNGRVIYRQNLESKHGHSIFFHR